jgi:predicted GTPase
MDTSFAEIAKRPNLIKTVVSRLRGLEREQPKVAVIGRAGVAKSTTLNKLFTRVQHCPSASRRGTRLPRRFDVLLGRDGLHITVVDYPGLGHSISSDVQLLPQHVEWIEDCDVAVWVISAERRGLGVDSVLLAATN